jgi:hypothetical protein
MVALSSCRSIVRLKLVDRGAVTLGSTPVKPNPIGSNCEKSMFLSPGEGGVKGNGIGVEHLPVASENGVAKPTEPQALPAPLLVIAK